MIKSCFKPKKGWILCGADFNALESRIDALVTQDPAKLDVYIHGYDSHAYNTYYYWKHKFPDIALAVEGELCIKLNGEYLKSDDVIHYKGKSYTVKEFYETFR